MAILGVRKKREEFYNNIKDIKFTYPKEFESGQDVKKYEKRLLFCITEPCKQLYRAIADEFSHHDQKSASRKYVDPIRTAALFLMDIKTIDEDACTKLMTLKQVCANASNAKFSKLTFGATVEYKPTLKKFEEWRHDLDILVLRTEKFSETKIVLEQQK